MIHSFDQVRERSLLGSARTIVDIGFSVFNMYVSFCLEVVSLPRVAGGKGDWLSEIRDGIDESRSRRALYLGEEREGGKETFDLGVKEKKVCNAQRPVPRDESWLLRLVDASKTETLSSLTTSERNKLACGTAIEVVDELSRPSKEMKENVAISFAS